MTPIPSKTFFRVPNLPRNNRVKKAPKNRFMTPPVAVKFFKQLLKMHQLKRPEPGGCTMKYRVDLLRYNCIERSLREKIIENKNLMVEMDPKLRRRKNLAYLKARLKLERMLRQKNSLP